MSFAVLAMRAVETLFFVGLAGCTAVVIISWVSVLKGCVYDKE